MINEIKKMMQVTNEYTTQRFGKRKATSLTEQSMVAQSKRDRGTQKQKQKKCRRLIGYRRHSGEHGTRRKVC
jgi:hypothetical protein